MAVRSRTLTHLLTILVTQLTISTVFSTLNGLGHKGAGLTRLVRSVPGDGIPGKVPGMNLPTPGAARFPWSAQREPVTQAPAFSGRPLYSHKLQDYKETNRNNTEYCAVHTATTHTDSFKAIAPLQPRTSHTLTLNLTTPSRPTQQVSDQPHQRHEQELDTQADGEPPINPTDPMEFPSAHHNFCTPNLHGHPPIDSNKHRPGPSPARQQMGDNMLKVKVSHPQAPHTSPPHTPPCLLHAYTTYLLLNCTSWISLTLPDCCHPSCLPHTHITHLPHDCISQLPTTLPHCHPYSKPNQNIKATHPNIPLQHGYISTSSCQVNWRITLCTNHTSKPVTRCLSNRKTLSYCLLQQQNKQNCPIQLERWRQLCLDIIHHYCHLSCSWNSHSTPQKLHIYLLTSNRTIICTISALKGIDKSPVTGVPQPNNLSRAHTHPQRPGTKACHTQLNSTSPQSIQTTPPPHSSPISPPNSNPLPQDNKDKISPLDPRRSPTHSHPYPRSPPRCIPWYHTCVIVQHACQAPYLSPASCLPLAICLPPVSPLCTQEGRLTPCHAEKVPSTPATDSRYNQQQSQPHSRPTKDSDKVSQLQKDLSCTNLLITITRHLINLLNVWLLLGCTFSNPHHLTGIQQGIFSHLDGSHNNHPHFPIIHPKNHLQRKKLLQIISELELCMQFPIPWHQILTLPATSLFKYTLIISIAHLLVYTQHNRTTSYNIYVAALLFLLHAVMFALNLPPTPSQKIKQTPPKPKKKYRRSPPNKLSMIYKPHPSKKVTNP